jgi:tetratricopeptide (TPR) repeat protein
LDLVRVKSCVYREGSETLNTLLWPIRMQFSLNEPNDSSISRFRSSLCPSRYEIYAQYLLETDMRMQAFATLYEAIRSHPSHLEPSRVQEILKHTAMEPASSPSSWYNEQLYVLLGQLAKFQLERNDDERAVVTLHEMVVMKPTDSFVHFSLGNAHRVIDFKMAEQHYLKALDYSSNPNCLLRANLAALYHMHERYRNALEQYDLALELNPQCRGVSSNLALLARLGYHPLPKIIDSRKPSYIANDFASEDDTVNSNDDDDADADADDDADDGAHAKNGFGDDEEFVQDDEAGYSALD